jgi:anti-anti-sigma regulatory factor
MTRTNRQTRCFRRDGMVVDLDQVEYINRSGDKSTVIRLKSGQEAIFLNTQAEHAHLLSAFETHLLGLL